MSARDRTILGVICLVAALVGPWILVIQPKRDQAAKLARRISSEQSQLNTVRAQLTEGTAAKAAFATSYATLVKLGEAVPTDDNTGSLIYQLQSAAQGAKVGFLGLTYNAGQAGPAPAPAPSSSSSASASTQASAATLPPGAVIGSAGFPVQPFTFTFQGNFLNLTNFLGRLQRLVTASNQNVSVSGRLMTLNAITLGSATGTGTTSSSQLQATISADTYLLPSAQGLTNGATPAGPASSSTQTVSDTSPSSSTPPAVVTAPTVR